ncbi:MAG TPA: hypothetical protein VL485_28170 [Ktedonobacteraceae bacterium]|nr:hypothetical protein [Ktedonobacteraceae bacterium]
MTSPAPPLQLGREQAERLLQYMQEYRRSALTSMPPTNERNTTLRQVQTLQGKLLVQLDRAQPQIQLVLGTEDVTALIVMIKSLLLLYAEKPDSLDRRTTVTDIGKLYAYLKQTYKR